MEGNGVSLGAVETAPIPELVRLRGQIFGGIVKAPFVKSGESIQGGIEVHGQHGTIKCHECGKWFSSLSAHVFLKHGITATEYKLRHSINLSTPLTSASVSARISSLTRQNIRAGKVPRLETGAHGNNLCRNSFQGRTSEQRNARRQCKAQVIDDLQKLRDRLGRAPRYSDMLAAGLSPESVIVFLGARNMRHVFELAGIDGHSWPQKGRISRYSRSGLIEELRDFYVQHRRLPFKREIGSALPSNSVFRRHFGGLVAAYEEAGLGLVAKGLA